MALQTLFLGDSVAYGSLGAGRLSVTPRETINLTQTVFEIPLMLDYTKGGAAISGWLDPDPLVREAHGLVGGVTLDDLFDDPTVEAVLICAGGNDPLAGWSSRIRTVAGKCIARSLPFAFVGLIDIDVLASYQYAQDNGIIPVGFPFYETGFIDAVADLAHKAETLRQVCRKEGYAYIDTRTLVDAPWGAMTGDFVHPNQAYSSAIFDRVGRGVAGLP